MMEIAGFTPRQIDLANRIWALDTPEQIVEFFDTLPRSLLRDAYIVYLMIVWEYIDEEPVTRFDETLELIERIKEKSYNNKNKPGE